MDSSAYIAIAVFVIAYMLIISEKIHRTIVALTGAMVMIIMGILSQDQAIHHIDFNTIGLLTGMMIMVNITSETGLFNYLAIWDNDCHQLNRYSAEHPPYSPFCPQMESPNSGNE